MDDDEKEIALLYAKGEYIEYATGRQFALVVRENEFCVLRYYIGSQFTVSWLPEQRLYAGYVVESSGQMQSYIQTLIDISRAAVGYQLHIESIDLPAFMQHLFGYMESLCRTKEIRLQMNTVSLPQMLKFDRVLIERAIMNVISNGLDYSRKAERFMWMFRVTTVSWKFQSQTRERGFLKRHYATHRNGSIWAIKAAIQSYTLIWVYILQIRLWNNIMVSLF